MKQEKPFFRLAHISDLHFSKLCWSPTQFLSKRWIGNLNLLLTRKQGFDPEGLTSLFPIFQQQEVDAVLITGDLSSTSLATEFALAREFIEHLQSENFKVFTLPGNHDHYTKNAYEKRRFYDFFEESYGPEASWSLKEDGLTIKDLGHNWSLIALDTALATPLLSSNGLFSQELEKKLETALRGLPQDRNVILMNHFPIFANESQRKSLLRKEALKALMERYPQIKLYLHGHSHRNCVADLRNSSLPIILDSGSVSQKSCATWNLIEITAKGCAVEVFKNIRSLNNTSWEPISKSQFTW